MHVWTPQGRTFGRLFVKLLPVLGEKDKGG
jgi:hypothetical protein